MGHNAAPGFSTGLFSDKLLIRFEKAGFCTETGVVITDKRRFLFRYFYTNRGKPVLPMLFPPLAILTPRPDLEVRQGDVLISRANITRLVSATAYVAKTRSRLMPRDKIFRALFQDPSPIDPEFLAHVFRTSWVRHQIEGRASGTSATMKNISKPSLLFLTFPLPSLDEQKHLVQRLNHAGESARGRRRQTERRVTARGKLRSDTRRQWARLTYPTRGKIPSKPVDRTCRKGNGSKEADLSTDQPQERARFSTASKISRSLFFQGKAIQSTQLAQLITNRRILFSSHIWIKLVDKWTERKKFPEAQDRKDRATSDFTAAQKNGCLHFEGSRFGLSVRTVAYSTSDIFSRFMAVFFNRRKPNGNPVFLRMRDRFASGLNPDSRDYRMALISRIMVIKAIGRIRV